MSHDTLARAVRRAHLAYSDELMAAIRARVPVETLLSWGVPRADIDQALYRKARLAQPSATSAQAPSGAAREGRPCSCGHDEGRHDDAFTSVALEGPRTCREVGCLCRTFVEYVKATSS